MKTLAQRLLPGGVLVAATLLLLVVPTWRETAVTFVPAYPNAAFAAGVVLAHRFRRYRVFFVVLLLAAAIALATTRAAARPYPIECGIMWAQVAALIAFATGAPSLASIAFAGAGLVLAVSLVEASYVIAYGDELTGLPGRRALMETLPRLHGVYSIAMVDIDHFKKFNDAYGHDVGDQLLRMVGARLGEVGGGGRAFRYGGEEFAIIFDDTGIEDVMPHLEALRHRIQTTGFALRAPDRPRHRPEAPRSGRPVQRVSVSVSIGAAASNGSDERPEDVLDAADAALYRAKDAGRNRVCT